jgi:hypothetical protein
VVVKKKTKAAKSNSGVIDIDLNKVEVREAYDGEDPRPGFYTFECVTAGTHTSQGGAEGFKWVFVLKDHPEYEGWTRTIYSNLESTKWKTEEILLALKGGNAVKGTKAAKVSLDMSSAESVKAFLKKAKLIRGRVSRERDSDDDDPSYGIGKIIALDEAKQAARASAKAALEDDDEDEDEDEDGFEDATEFEDADEDDEDDSDDDEDEEEDDDSDEEDDDEDSDDDDDEDDEDEEEEEEEPEPPAKKAKKSSAKASTKTSTKAASNVTPIKAAKGKKKK